MMKPALTKKELIQALESYNDNDDIVIQFDCTLYDFSIDAVDNLQMQDGSIKREIRLVVLDI